MESHLLQMRGLKPKNLCIEIICIESHLLQMRGLKRSGSKGEDRKGVASFTDAWIETKRKVNV